MGRIREAWKALTHIAEKTASVNESIEDQITAWFGGGVAADGSPATLEDFITTPTVYRAVTRIGYDLASAPIVIEQRQGKDWHAVESGDQNFGDAAGVFERANPDEGRTALWTRFHIGMEVSRGKGYLFTDYLNDNQVPGPRDHPKELRALRPDGVTELWPTMRQPFEGPSGYRYSENGASLSLRPDEVMMHVFPSPAGQYVGLSPLEAAKAEARIEKALAQFRGEFFLNGARGSVAILTDKILNADQRQDFRESWREDQATLGKRQGLWLLTGGMKIHELTGAKETDFVELSKIVLEHISMVFGVPPAFLNNYGDSGVRANLEEQTPIYVEGTLDPKWTLLEQNLTEIVLPRFLRPGVDPSIIRARVDRDRVPMIQRMNTDRAKAISLGVGGPWLLRNEARAIMKLPPIEGGDDLYEQAAAFGAPDSGGPPPPPAKRVRKIATKALDRTDSAREARRRLKGNTLSQIEGPAIVKVLAYFDARRDAMLSRLSAEKSLATKDWSDDYDDDEEEAAARDLVLEITSAVAHRRGPQAAVEVGGQAQDFLVNDPAVVQFLTSNAYSEGVLIAGTTKELLRRLLSESNAGGETVQDLASRIVHAFDVRRSSALTIARTETVRAYNATSDLAWAATGLVESTVWLTAHDDAVRSFADGDEYDHTLMDGVEMPLGEDFAVPGAKGYDYVAFPGDSRGAAGNVINCRCTKEPKTKDSALLPAKTFRVEASLEKIFAGDA